MPRRLLHAVMSRLDAAMAWSARAFIDFWSKVERAFRRPLSRLSRRMGFAFYPLLALGAVLWLGWDWSHTRSLDAAEDAIFDKVVKWRPVEPKPSGRVVVVEIDDCSIEHFRRLGEGGWPWGRQRHADLLDQLDRAGVRAVGYDVLFSDRSTHDPVGDATLDAMADGGGGRFLFGSSRMHPDYDAASTLRAAHLPGAFALRPDSSRPGPRVALLLPYGTSMARHSAVTNIARGQDGILRDVPLRESVDGWALPSLPLQLAALGTARAASSFPASVRVNWRKASRLPRISAADLLEGGKPICRDEGASLPALRDRIVLVGYTAAGLNDSKPTPVDPVMPGVEVLAEATEALVAGSAIWMPPTWVKYVLAGMLVLLASFAFFRGEPANDVDSVFIATNFSLLLLAFSGLTFLGAFFDIFASVGFVSLCFGLCRLYAGIQRGRAVGHGDFLVEFNPEVDRWLVLARLRFNPRPLLDAASVSRLQREYRRRLRRFLYAGCDAVMLEGIVERKSWLHATLDELMVLVWKGGEESVARSAARRDLDALFVHLNEYDDRIDDDGTVKICLVSAEIDDNADQPDHGKRLREALGRVLVSSDECPLLSANSFVSKQDAP